MRVSGFLQSMIEVHLLVDTPENWVKAMNQGHSALIKIMDAKPSAIAPAVQDFVEISSSKVSADQLISTLSSSKDIKDVDLVRLGPHTVMGTITTQNCPVCSTLSGLNCSLLSAVTREDSKMEWRLLLSGDDTLKKVTDRLDSQQIGFKILQLAHLNDVKDLTARQEQIVKMALEMGYFEFPKKIRLEELSSRLGISAGTLSEILRRAEKNILTRYFREH
ncbi:MAG: helix-turn-helix domain-containing protein [archaeon]|nr:helix-turn-helix domain-containing protein [archaeon]